MSERIDLIAERADEVKLVMTTPSAMHDVADQEAFQARPNAYLSFALDGELARRYPGRRRVSIEVRLDSVSAEIAEWLRLVGEQVALEDVTLSVVVGRA